FRYSDWDYSRHKQPPVTLGSKTSRNESREREGGERGEEEREGGRRKKQRKERER
ncbi:hypothetical protein NFI96_019187, partial [Prochilodus magdalenae]